MNRTKATAAFDEYVSNYDPDNPLIHLKVIHSYKVAEIAERIARSLNNEELVDFAWMLGLLHDIGRFEQARRYNTFVDSQSVDHAELGADILFKEDLIDRFPTETLPDGWRQTAETAIRQHNKLAIAEGLDERTKIFSEILRDADKVDIFRVLSEIPYADRHGSGGPVLPETDEVSPEVMACVREHRCVPSGVRKTRFDKRVSHCCFAFELVFEESRKIVSEQGNLLKLLTMQDMDGRCCGNDEQLRQLALVQREIEKSWEL